MQHPARSWRDFPALQLLRRGRLGAQRCARRGRRRHTPALPASGVRIARALPPLLREARAGDRFLQRAGSGGQSWRPALPRACRCCSAPPGCAANLHAPLAAAADSIALLVAPNTSPGRDAAARAGAAGRAGAAARLRHRDPRGASPRQDAMRPRAPRWHWARRRPQARGRILDERRRSMRDTAARGATARADRLRGAARRRCGRRARGAVPRRGRAADAAATASRDRSVFARGALTRGAVAGRQAARALWDGDVFL